MYRYFVVNRSTKSSSHPPCRGRAFISLLMYRYFVAPSSYYNSRLCASWQVSSLLFFRRCK
nr:MAG TPA: hypothetical protein [Caudoviricetes sp.]